MRLFLVLASLSSVSLAPAFAEGNWQDLFAKAVSDMKAPKTGILDDSWHNDLLLLRQAWLAHPKTEQIDDSDHQQMKQAFVTLFEKRQMPELKTWYQSATCAAIDARIRNKLASSAKSFAKKWRVVLMSDGTIQIRSTNNVAKYSYYLSDSRYEEIKTTVGELVVGKEVPARFDVSSIVPTIGPSFYPIW